MSPNELIRPRLNLLTELTSSSFYFFNKPKSYNVKAVKKLCGSNATSELLKLSCCFLETNVFKAKEIKLSLEHFTKTSGLNFGKALGLVRLAPNITQFRATFFTCKNSFIIFYFII